MFCNGKKSWSCNSEQTAHSKIKKFESTVMNK